MVKKKVQIWVDPECRNLLKCGAARRGMKMGEFTRMLAEEKIDIPLIKVDRKKKWYGL